MFVTDVWDEMCSWQLNRMKRRNPPCAAPPLSSFPMGKKHDTTQRGASQGGFLLFILFISPKELEVKFQNHFRCITNNCFYVSSGIQFSMHSIVLVVYSWKLRRPRLDSKAHISNIHALNSDTHSLRIQYDFTQKQCVGVAIEGMDIWYMGIIWNAS